MRRVAALFVLCAAVLGVTASAAVARTSLPAGVVGTYSYSEPGGYKITVGYAPCGTDVPDYSTDPPGVIRDANLRFFAQVDYRQSTARLWTHSPTNLDAQLFGYYGFHLTDKAWQTLNDDAATFPCNE